VKADAWLCHFFALTEHFLSYLCFQVDFWVELFASTLSYALASWIRMGKLNLSWVVASNVNKSKPIWELKEKKRIHEKKIKKKTKQKQICLDKSATKCYGMNWVFVLKWPSHHSIVVLSMSTLFAYVFTLYSTYFLVLFDFGFAHLTLDTFLRFSFVCRLSLISYFLTCLYWLSFEFVYYIFHLMLSNSFIFELFLFSQFFYSHAAAWLPLVLFWILQSHCFWQPCRWSLLRE